MLQSMSPRTRLMLGGGALAVVLVSLVAVAASLPGRSSPAAPPTVEEAVARGVLDQELLDGIRGEGEAIGFISLDWAAISSVLPADARSGANPRALTLARAAIAEAKRRLLSELGDRVDLEREFELLTNLAVRFRSEEAVLMALRFPLVTAIRADTPLVEYVDQSRQIVRQPEVWNRGFGGAGTYVAVIDGGVDASDRQWFPEGSVPESYRAVGADGSALKGGHGTHVASTVLAMAPETKVIAVDVFSSNLLSIIFGPSAKRSSILDGVEHVIRLKEANRADPTVCCNVVAMNLSLGKANSFERSECSDDYSFRRAFDLGIVPVVASGNDATDKNGVFHAGIGHPACAARALSVGATTDGVFEAIPDRCIASTQEDVPTSFSQVGENLGILAPGSCIVAAGGALNGTSMAAPHVAGAAAVLAGARPDASAEEIVNALVRSGTPISDPRMTPPNTTNRLDIAAALELLLSGGTAATPSPTSDTTAPSVRPPVAVMGRGTQLQPNGDVPVTVSWTASDASGIAGYEVRMRRDGGEWAALSIGSSTSTSVAATLAPGHTYAFAAEARDPAGNRSGFVESESFEVVLLQESDPAIVTTGGAWAARADGEALGGSIRGEIAAGAEACLTAEGRQLAWIAPLRPGLGRGSIWLDDVRVATIDLAQATRPRAVAYPRPLVTGRSQELCIRVEGPDASRAVEIDGFIVFR